MTFDRQPNTFLDPAGVREAYQWPLNHEEEEQVQNSRQMGSGAPTNDISLIPQQGAKFPLIFQWKGKLFTQHDKDEMDAWYRTCDAHSIFLSDAAANVYEVLITDWDAQRKTGYNPRGNGLPFFWEYTITFHVLTVIDGDWSHLF
jgi:hypothetical protein